MVVSESLGLQYVLDRGWCLIHCFPSSPPSNLRLVSCHFLPGSSHLTSHFSIFTITQQLAGARSVLGSS